jgi:signal transduction histidine kinase
MYAGSSDSGSIPILDSAPLHLYGQPVASPSEPALAGLVAFSLDLSRLRSTEGVMRRALAGCLELTGSETGFLDLIDEEGSFPPRTRVAGDVDANLVARHRPRLLEQGEHELAVIAERKYLLARLEVRGTRIGTVAVAAPASRRRVADRRLLRSLANQTATILDSIDLSRRQRSARLGAKGSPGGSRLRRKQTEDARRRVLDQLVAAHEEERRRIADDIHADSLQVLDAAILRLDMLSRNTDGVVRTGQLGEVKAAVAAAEHRLRILLFDLRPAAIEAEDGLRWAVQEQLERMEQTTAIEWKLEIRPGFELGIEARLAVFRIAQEALRNVARHAKARSVRVRFEKQGGGVLASIRDDGRGFVAADPLSPAGHFGLTEMAGRAELAGGWVRIASNPGQGTAVEYWLPA